MRKSLLIISLMLNLTFIVLFVLNRQNQIKEAPSVKIKPKADTIMRVNRFMEAFQEHRRNYFDAMPIPENAIVMLGNSLTNQGEWSEMFGNKNIINRGIAGDNTDGILARLPQITQNNPAKVFLMIGINDLSDGKNTGYILNNYKRIVEHFETKKQLNSLHIQSLLPVNKDILYTETIKYEDISDLNFMLKDLAKKKNIPFINLYQAFATSENKLKPELTNDGLHINGKGYLLWKSLISKFIN